MPAARRVLELESFLHALHLYGAAAIAAFGWGICRLLGCESGPWWPLWFCGGLLVYNADRLRPDPADDVNIPQRVAAFRRWRPWSLALAITAAGLLVALPLARADWLTLAAAVVGTAFCLHYSLPFRGRRWKDVPLLKTFFAPGIVAASVFGLPFLHEPRRLTSLYTVAVLAWCAAPLLVNMMLCDGRDLKGDRARGVISLPARLGLRRTERLLWWLAGLSGILAATLATAGPPASRAYWLVLWPAGALYLSCLIIAARSHPSERFYERWVEGLLFLPAAVVLTLDLCLH